MKHTPEFAHNLISMSMLDKHNYRGEWGQCSLTVKSREGNIAMVGIGKGRMYEVEVLYNDQTEINSARSQEKAVDIITWHH